MSDHEVPPALPFLASALLDLEQERYKKVRGLSDLHTGSKDVDDEVGSIWNESGALIGIAGVKERMAEEVSGRYGSVQSSREDFPAVDHRID